MGSFGALLTTMGHNSETAHHRAKQIKKKSVCVCVCGGGGGPGRACSIYMGNFDLEHANVIWGHTLQFSQIEL